MTRSRWLPRLSSDPIVRARQWSIALFSTVLATVLGFGIGAVSGAQESQPQAELGTPIVMSPPAPATAPPSTQSAPAETSRSTAQQTSPAQPAAVSPIAAAPTTQTSVPTAAATPTVTSSTSTSSDDPARTWWNNWLKQFDSRD